MIKQLAKVRSAGLNILDRGIMTIDIYVDYEEFGSQNVCNIVIDDHDKKLKKRVGTEYGCNLIRNILVEFNVNDLHEMKGQVIWVLGEGEGLQFKPLGVQSLKCVNTKSEPVLYKPM